MNSGYPVLGLGILAIIVGAISYITKFHRTIGLGGIGLGVLLVILGVWMARKTMMKSKSMSS